MAAELHVLSDGAVKLRLGTYGLDEAHALIGESGYPGLLWPLLGDGHAIGVAVTPWVVCLHLPAPSTFDGILGGTTAFWTMAALPAPSLTDNALLVQAVAWLSACRRLPQSLGPDTGPVGKARQTLGASLASWKTTTVVRADR